MTMSSKWFMADPHFGSERALTRSNRPFQTVAEMDHFMLTTINALPENAVLYVVGDWGEYYRMIERVRPDIQVVLIYGNYENHHARIHCPIKTGFATFEERLLSLGFKALHFHNLVVPLENGVSVNLVHKPTDANRTMFNLFGHIHRLQMVKRCGLNVGVDCHNYAPISEETVLQYQREIDEFYDEDVFCS